MAYLKSIKDQIEIQILEGQSLLLGRLLKCDVVLEDPSISAQHVRLDLKDHHLLVTDLGSTNGTRLNYGRVDGPVYLQDGDTIEFGNVTFTVDGPELTTPKELPDETKSARMALLNASQPLDQTIPNLEVNEADLANGDLAQTATTPAAIPLDPLLSAFYLALALILVGGLLILGSVWNLPAPR